MEITGVIKFVGKTEQITDSFKKREIVVTTKEAYPQHILIEFAQDKCGLLDNYQLGENVKVSINLRGREWVNPQGETKFFNSIQGWRIEKMQAETASAPQISTMPASGAFEPVTNHKEDEEDDLPF